MHEDVFTSYPIGKDKQSGLGRAQRSLFLAFENYYYYPAVLFLLFIGLLFLFFPMHYRSGSADSSLAIRTNPLNIRFSDGSDWVMDKYATAEDNFAEAPISTGMVKHGIASTKPGAKIAKRPESAVIVANDDGNTVPRYNVFKRPAKPASQRYRPRSQSSVTSNTSSDSIGVTPVDAEKPALPVPPKSMHRKCSSDILADIIKKNKAEKQQQQQRERPKTVIDTSPNVSDDFDFSEEPQNQPDYMYSVPQLDSQSDYSSSAPSLNQTQDNSPDLVLQPSTAPSTNKDDYLSLSLSHSPDLDLTSSFMKSYTNMSLPTHYSDLRPPQQAELGRKNTITSTKGFKTQPSEKASHEAFEKINTEMSPQLEEDSPIVISEHLPPKRQSVFYEDSIFEEEAASDDNKDLYSLPMSDSGQPSINSPTLSSSGDECDNASTCVSSHHSEDKKLADDQHDEKTKEPINEQKNDEAPVLAPLPEHKRLPLDHADRGRLFLKICGVKDISLPVDESRNPTFQLTLDNGIQCVTTYPLSMSSDYTSIDQEFELVVAEDLKLMLTLTGYKQDKKKEPTVSKPSSPATSAEASTASLPTTRPSSPNKKKSMFNIFTSPKKKKQQQLQNKQLASVSSSKLAAQQDQDPWEKATGPKGEFARCYVIESQVEKEVYGQARTFALPCFAEWDSKRYRIATIQVVMMYIPKVYKQEPLPPSLSSCQKVINQALNEDSKIVSLSGFLSQEGGDCSYWRRRWFELKDGKLIGKHEDTGKVKLEIDLENDPDLKVYEDPEDATLYGKRAFKIVYSGSPRGITFLSESEQSRNQWLFVIFTVRSWLGLVTKTLRQSQSDPSSGSH